MSCAATRFSSSALEIGLLPTVATGASAAQAVLLAIRSDAIVARRVLIVFVPLGDGVAARDFSEEAPAVLDDALLGFVVDVDHAETLGVAVGPFEVVDQGPAEIAAQASAVFDGAVCRG